ncbi:lipase family alpha/beta hydrolase [Ideonella sp. YS5]|uniref:lipase family alpha/beta hydrolase n=1 Tax=Ideonella sp. YS5 TaxID=3453714 RepID=UPI003EECB7EF
MVSERPPAKVTPERRRPLTAADVRGLWQLGIDAGLNITDLVEQMHATIAAHRAPLGGPHRGGTRGITGFVYGSVRRGMRLVGRGVGRALQWVEPSGPAAVGPPREAALAVANGLWGDHLAASSNPLCIRMSLKVDGRSLAPGAAGLAVAFPAARERVAVLVHGLCMNDLQWERQGHHHGRVLQELGCSVVAAHYNTGLHVSQNGASLASLLQGLVQDWPVPVRELLLVGHSMGGLVARTAIWQAEQQSLGWRDHLGGLVCLGTPHHGALLERGGHLVDSVLEMSPYLSPFARLGKSRSAGITDLRWGNLRDEDWQGRDLDGPSKDERVATPLPEGVPVYLLAATTVEKPRGLRHAVVGDGLVTVASAWGEHRDPKRTLAVPPSHKRLIAQANHWDLLSRPEAADALRAWLA